jgi:hypothetical protein
VPEAMFFTYLASALAIMLALIFAFKVEERFSVTGLATLALAIATIFLAWDAHQRLPILSGQLQEMQTDSIIKKNEIRARIQRNTTTEITATGLAEATGLINIGKSDAQYFTGWNDIRFFEPEAADRFDFGKNPDDPSETISLPTQEIVTNDVRRAMNKEGVIIHWGYIEYRDIFPESPVHYLHWCMLLNFHPTGNGQFTLTLPILYKAECNTSG